MKTLFKNPPIILMLIGLSLFALQVNAAVDSANVLDNVVEKYQGAASAWVGVITAAATWLYWTLTAISLAWTFGFMALRKADIGEFFTELVRFIIFTGFFYWLLVNGPNFATDIINSLKQLGGKATGLGGSLSPSGVVDIGFNIFGKIVDQSSMWSPVASGIGMLIGAVILVILALIGVNMVLLLVSGWILAYGGIFFLGFGGSRWTSDMAINYYKTVLGVAASLMTMILLVGIGKTFIDDYYARMSAGITLKEMGVMLVVAAVLLALTNKVPSLVSGIITGCSVGSASGVGGFGAGAALGAAGMAVAAAATGGAALAAGASGMAGGAQAIMSAVSKASQNMASGSGMFSGGASGGGDGGSGDSGSGGSTPLASAMGGSSSDSSSPMPSSDGGNSSTSSGDTEKSSGSDTGSNDSSSSTDDASSNIGSSESSSPTSSSAEISGGDYASVLGSGSAPGQQDGSGSSKLATAARFTADVGANLAKGIGAVAKAKAQSSMASTQGRISQTTGGKIAEAIKASGATPTSSTSKPSFEGNSLSGSKETTLDKTSEVASFRDSKST